MHDKKNPTAVMHDKKVMHDKNPTAVMHDENPTAVMHDKNPTAVMHDKKIAQKSP